MVGQLIDSLKANFTDQIELYERKISNLTKRVDQQNQLIKKLMEEKKLDRFEILRLEKKVANTELDNSRLEKLSQTFHLATEVREKGSFCNTGRRIQTEESEIGNKVGGRWMITEPKLTGRL